MLLIDCRTAAWKSLVPRVGELFMSGRSAVVRSYHKEQLKLGPDSGGAMLQV